jgi:hypothetical protein
MDERNLNRFRLHESEGHLAYHLVLFGDHIREREGYKDSGLDGIDAVHYYLINKYSWLPRDVKSMSYEDLRFVLREEMHGWQAPPEVS